MQNHVQQLEDDSVAVQIEITEHTIEPTPSTPLRDHPVSQVAPLSIQQPEPEVEQPYDRATIIDDVYLNSDADTDPADKDSVESQEEVTPLVTTSLPPSGDSPRLAGFTEKLIPGSLRRTVIYRKNLDRLII